MQGMLVMGEYDRDTMKSELNALMNKSPDEPLGTPENIKESGTNIDYTALENKALNNNFGLAQKKYMYQSSLADSKLSKMEWFPDLMAEARISNVSDNSTYMAAVQLPLYFWNRVSETKSKTARSDAMGQNLESEKNSVRLALKNMYLQYTKNIKLLKIYNEDILPSAKQAVQISEAGYRTGKIEFQYLLDLQKKYLDFETEYNRLTAENQMYYAELELIAGGTLK
jgi:outer membrane protein TolC